MYCLSVNFALPDKLIWKSPCLPWTHVHKAWNEKKVNLSILTYNTACTNFHNYSRLFYTEYFTFLIKIIVIWNYWTFNIFVCIIILYHQVFHSLAAGLEWVINALNLVNQVKLLVRWFHVAGCDMLLWKWRSGASCLCLSNWIIFPQWKLLNLSLLPKLRSQMFVKYKHAPPT